MKWNVVRIVTSVRQRKNFESLWRIEPQTVGFWAPMLCQRSSEVQILMSAFSLSFVLRSWSDESCPFLFLNILYRDVMLFWSFFDQVRCGLHICFVFFFFLSQRLLNCPRHGEFSPNGIDLSKEWHFLFYFVQIFYALPAHKSRIYIT